MKYNIPYIIEGVNELLIHQSVRQQRALDYLSGNIGMMELFQFMEKNRIQFG